MAMKQTTRALLAVISSMLLVSVEEGCATEVAQPEASPYIQADPQSPPDGGTTSAPQASADSLDQLVAPIALYPDELVAQVLAAATFPSEVVEADQWVKQHTDLKGDALAKAVDPQSWDASVKALVQFPSVLEMMDKDLSWTSSLGDAYVNQRQNVLDAVQAMRQRAQQAGNLKSTQQESVTSEGQTIAIEPTDPEVVYVPEYDPWVVYGDPLPYYPGWVGVPGVYLDGPGIAFGLGIGIGVFGGYGWGWHHWGADWHHHDVMHDHQRYMSHSPTFDHHPDFGHGFSGHAGGFAHGAVPHGGFTQGGLAHGGQGGFQHGGPGGFPHAGGVSGAAPSGMHSSAFSGFNHGGVTHAFSARGQASSGGGFHGGGGGFHGGGGSHGGGGGHR